MTLTRTVERLIEPYERSGIELPPAAVDNLAVLRAMLKNLSKERKQAYGAVGHRGR